MKKNIVIAYSGGFDSYMLYHYAKKTQPDANVTAVYWDHGQDVAQKELSIIPDFVEVRKVDWLNLKGKGPVECPGRNEGPIFIPGRNLVFGILLACQDLPHEIWMGTLGGETHNKGTDKNYQFLWSMNTTINYVLSPFYGEDKCEVKFPFADADMNKKEVLKWALDNGITKEEIIKHTYSCHKGEDVHCGECVQCVKRWSIFGELGFTEEYQIDPGQSKRVANMLDEMSDTLLGKQGGYYNLDSIEEVWYHFSKYALENPEYYSPKLIKKIKQAILAEEALHTYKLD